jgi:hypothetical protein
MKDLRLFDRAWRARVGFDNIMTELEIARELAKGKKTEKRKRAVVGGTR